MRRDLAAILAATMIANVLPITALAENSPVDEKNIATTADSTLTSEIKYNYDGSEHTRQMEKLDRGLIAIKTSEGVYLSWRLLGDEASVSEILNAPTFKVYKNNNLLATVDSSTNFVDKSGSLSDVYSVAPEKNGVVEAACESVTVQSTNYKSINLDVPDNFINGETAYSYTVGDTSCGDLDGDGEYELVVKWDANPQDNSNAGITGNVLLDAYKLDGTKLWRIDLGRNIRAGAHYTQFLVYDFDLDGKAEVTCKTAPGSIDGKGNYVSAASADTSIQGADNSISYVNDGGYILEGPEYFTIFNGENGSAIDTINYPVQRVSAATWGDSYGNRCDRYVADVSYMDGEKPYAVYWRGYYFGQSGYGERTGVFAASFDGERLSVPDNHIFDTLSTQPGYRAGNEMYVGMGNHNMTTADVDDDGCDEIFSGALSLGFNNDVLSPRWCSNLGHGDALHIGDYDPTHQGLEFFTVHEDAGLSRYGNVMGDYGASVFDPNTGEILKHWAGSKDTGRGLMANVGAGGYYQITATSGVDSYMATGDNTFVKMPTTVGYNFRVFWNGDIYDETLNGTAISAWNGSGMSDVFYADGCIQINGTKANPALQADLYGDWREEVVYPTSDNTTLRIFSTTDETEYKLPTLMHDPVYRSGVASEQSAYNQPPHIGFYLADEIFKPSVDYIEITNKPNKTSYFVGENLDTTGLEVMAHYVDGSTEIVDSYVLKGFDSNIVNTQEITVTYAKKTTSFDVTVNSGFKVDEDGYITDYILDDTTASLPENINGIAVKGFKDGALLNTSLKEITVTLEDLLIGENVFPSDITINCFMGSDIYAYAVENNLKYNAIDSKSYLENITFSEADYAGLNILQGTTAQTTQINHIVYGVGARTNGGDGTSGIQKSSLDNEDVLRVYVGRFSNGSRNPYFLLNDIPALSSTVDTVYETDVYIDSANTQTKMYIFDSANATTNASSKSITVSPDPIDTLYIGNSDNIEGNTWYNYRIMYHNGAYYRSLVKKGEDANYIKLSNSPTETGIVKFAFAPDKSNYEGTFYFDNMKVYTASEFPTLTINVTDESGEPIEGATVSIGDTTLISNSDGSVSQEVKAGVYNVKIEAPGYISVTKTVGAYTNPKIKNFALKSEYIELTGLSFEKALVSLKKGQKTSQQPNTIPSNATDKSVKWLSSNDSIASVDDNGTVTAISVGEVTITAISDYNNNITASYTVKVFDNYDSVLTTLMLSDPQKAYIPMNGTINNAKYSVKGYDQNNVEIRVSNLAWDAAGLSINDGIVSIPSDSIPGEYTITVEANGITAKSILTLDNIIPDNDILAKLDMSKTINLYQAAAVQDPISIEGIKYEVAARSSGGDGRSGFTLPVNVDGKEALSVGIGAFSNSNRGGKMTFEAAPNTYDTNKAYVYETDIYIDNNSIADDLQAGTFMYFKDASDVSLFSLNDNYLEIDEKKWYHLQLVYYKGEYTIYLYDNNGAMLKSFIQTSTNNNPISSIMYSGSTSFSTGTYGMYDFSGLKYYTTNNPVNNISIKVIDENNNPITNATVSTGCLSSTTDSTGRAKLSLPIGVYNIDCSYEELSSNLKVVSNEASGLYTAQLVSKPIEDKIIIDNDIVTINASNNSMKLFSANYNEDGTLNTIKLYDVIEGLNEFQITNDPDKLFLWNNMKSVDKVEK